MEAEIRRDLAMACGLVDRSWEACLREAAVSPGDCQRLSRAFLYPGLELDPEVRG